MLWEFKKKKNIKETTKKYCSIYGPSVITILQTGVQNYVLRQGVPLCNG